MCPGSFVFFFFPVSLHLACGTVLDHARALFSSLVPSCPLLRAPVPAVRRDGGGGGATAGPPSNRRPVQGGAAAPASRRGETGWSAPPAAALPPTRPTRPRSVAAREAAVGVAAPVLSSPPLPRRHVLSQPRSSHRPRERHALWRLCQWQTGRRGTHPRIHARRGMRRDQEGSGSRRGMGGGREEKRHPAHCRCRLPVSPPLPPPPLPSPKSQPSSGE